MARAAQEYDVTFIEEPETGAAEGLREYLSREGVRVLTPVLPPGLTPAGRIRAQRRLLAPVLAPAEHALAWCYTPMAVEIADLSRFGALVYDCMDELRNFKGAPERLAACEEALFREADVVFAGGRSLFEAKRRQHPRVRLFPSSVDAAHFRRARDPATVEPADQAQLPRPRIGYSGVIDERMDLELLAGAARLRPHWSFVMLGPVAKIEEQALPRAANIHWLGMKDYADLPRYFSGWDAGFINFALNEATRFISPTKTPEYLAAGLPVVATPVADVVADFGALGLVQIVANAEEAVAALERFWREPRAPWLSRVDAFLGAHSWARTWSAMRAELAQIAPRSAAAVAG